MRVAFMPPTWPESSSFNSLHSFNYDPYAAGNSYTPADTQTGPVISVPEPDKIINAKLKLSRELGLQPRQIAVWFQNRRARWKAKQLEQLYDSLRQEYDVVSREKQMLHEEVKKLRAILRDHGLIKKQISGVTSGEDTTEIPSVVTTKVYGTDQYNNQMVVASSCWPSYP
ncbi:hypothetical protein F2Q68_00000100 [Brassica cretica]|uniref:Homeobox-leucine zipper protein n=1 Tax=Brassica cretica TaxID=69181 RepID=A0A8S9J6X9_BRACR|nr:hypothetical protein F2Q68_00000100 [Brassica cretica]